MSSESHQRFNIRWLKEDGKSCLQGNILRRKRLCKSTPLAPSALSTLLIVKADDVASFHLKPHPALNCLMWSTCLGNQNQLLCLPANLKLRITQGTIPELTLLVVRLSAHRWPRFTFSLGGPLLLWAENQVAARGRSGPACHISLLLYLETSPHG